jgi:aminoglycoside phosphotransferase (APT) family kinase protein
MAYLLERNLISAEAVVDGGLRIVDHVSHRNRVFIVTSHGEQEYVVKQPSDGDGGGVRREALVLEALRAANRRLAARLPAPVSYDAGRGVLVLEAARDSRDLSDCHARGRFARDLAAKVGWTLALLHATPPATLGRQGVAWDSRWALRLHRPSLTIAQQMLTGAAWELVRTIQQSQELCAALDELDASLREVAVIHGDVRWDNILSARASGASPRRSRVLLIDWEFAGRGDPSLDVGAFFGEYLRAWLRSIPIVDPFDPGCLLAHAGRPLKRMRPAINAFWLSYARHSPAAAPELGRLLRRAASCAAVRVLAHAFEESLSQGELPGRARFALQLSLNILQRPDEAIAHLLGIGASWDQR